MINIKHLVNYDRDHKCLYLSLEKPLPNFEVLMDATSCDSEANDRKREIITARVCEKVMFSYCLSVCLCLSLSLGYNF